VSEISVGRLPYGDDGEQTLEQLREQHHATHVFRRDGACSILAVPVAPEAPLIGERETILLSEHLPLAAALIRNALLREIFGCWSRKSSFAGSRDTNRSRRSSRNWKLWRRLSRRLSNGERRRRVDHKGAATFNEIRAFGSSVL
jgi:hypothetical protein